MQSYFPWYSIFCIINYKMGNFVYEASLKVTNSGMIGKAKIDEKFVLWFK